jgi:hypothetical protein
MKVKKWKHSEELLLINNYEDKTIKELLALFPDRTVDSINLKIKRLKASGKIKGTKSREAVNRAYAQRSK